MNRFIKVRSSQSGWVLFEVIISTIIIMVLLSYLIPILMQAKQHSDVVQQHLQRQSWAEGFKDNLRAQWKTIVWGGCNNSSIATVEIGHAGSFNLPERIKNKSLERGSDWLKGKVTGQCGTIQEIEGNEFEFESSCQWKTNQTVFFSHCEAEHQGWVSQISGSKVTVQFNSIEPDVMGAWPNGLLFRTEPYVWYLSAGKNDQMAFWRTPLMSGNSLELWSGVKKIAIYPMLDSDLDGTLDTLSTEYGEFTAAKLNAFWVEAIVTSENCRDRKWVSARQYKNFRGDVWLYQSRCDSIIDFIVPLSVF